MLAKVRYDEAAHITADRRMMAAVLVALNAIFQVLAYAALAYFYRQLLPGWLGLQTVGPNVSMGQIAGIVWIALPLLAYFAIMWAAGFGTGW